MQSDPAQTGPAQPGPAFCRLDRDSGDFLSAKGTGKGRARGRGAGVGWGEARGAGCRGGRGPRSRAVGRRVARCTLGDGAPEAFRKRSGGRGSASESLDWTA